MTQYMIEELQKGTGRLAICVTHFIFLKVLACTHFHVNLS